MTTAQIIVTLAGFASIIWIGWYFWFSSKPGAQASMSDSGVQEASIVVKGGYSPDVILVKAGKPVRLNFTRNESAACTEMVVFGDFNKSAKLPEGEMVSLELLPEQAGEYNFGCQMGMIRGKLIVS